MESCWKRLRRKWLKDVYFFHPQQLTVSRSIITGTRTPVRSIVSYHKNGLTAEEIAAKLHYLRLSEIYDALAFYYDNKDLIEKDIAENSNEEYWMSQIEKNVP